MKTIATIFALLFSTTAFAQSAAWICSGTNTNGRLELFAVQKPNGASFRIVQDIKANKNYSALVEDVADNRVDYQTKDFTIAFTVLGIRPADCNGENSIPASLFRAGQRQPTYLCCEDEQVVGPARR